MSGRFGIPVTSVHALGSEFNHTFEVRANSGHRYVAKVFDRDDVDSVRWQHRLMDRIAAVGDVVVPHVLRDADGRDYRLRDRRSRSSAAYTWVDGAVIGNLPRHSVALLEDWGRTAGRMVSALADIGVDVPSPNTHTWDLINAPAVIRQHLGDVPDEAHRALVLGAVDLFETWVTPRISELPKAVVHQDLNDFNVLVAGTGDAARIAGVIDFGDAIYTTRVSEVAIAAAYSMQRKDAPVDALTAVARGYRRRGAAHRSRDRHVVPAGSHTVGAQRHRMDSATARRHRGLRSGAFAAHLEYVAKALGAGRRIRRGKLHATLRRRETT